MSSLTHNDLRTFHLSPHSRTLHVTVFSASTYRNLPFYLTIDLQLALQLVLPGNHQ